MLENGLVQVRGRCNIRPLHAVPAVVGGRAISGCSRLAATGYSVQNQQSSRQANARRPRPNTGSSCAFRWRGAGSDQVEDGDLFEPFRPSWELHGLEPLVPGGAGQLVPNSLSHKNAVAGDQRRCRPLDVRDNGHV